MFLEILEEKHFALFYNIPEVLRRVSTHSDESHLFLTSLGKINTFLKVKGLSQKYVILF